MGFKKPNNLLGQHSPYLLQHAYNPVHWYPWGEAAIKRALEENRLLIISIGYSACHWCHVMEHESFEDQEVADIMNAHYVSIKVDREERPDIDMLYMTACQILSGRGGWPLNVIALPDQRPLFAGTYFSKRDWISVLTYYEKMFRLRRAELQEQAIETAKLLRGAIKPPALHDRPSDNQEILNRAYEKWLTSLDFQYGGTWGAPKFPMPGALKVLLYFGFYTKDDKILNYIHLTLSNMGMGGIYDHLGGGFSRYSVDGQWKIPHFEKMLYDNAQMLSLYANFYSYSKERLALKVLYIKRDKLVHFPSQKIENLMSTNYLIRDDIFG